MKSEVKFRPKCNDNCALLCHRDRWIKGVRDGREFFECGACGRFVGYLPPKEIAKGKATFKE